MLAFLTFTLPVYVTLVIFLPIVPLQSFRAPCKGPVSVNGLQLSFFRGNRHAGPLMCLIKARVRGNKNKSKKRLNERNISETCELEITHSSFQSQLWMHWN